MTPVFSVAGAKLKHQQQHKPQEKPKGQAIPTQSFEKGCFQSTLCSADTFQSGLVLD